jgi:hypothetical protein
LSVSQITLAIWMFHTLLNSYAHKDPMMTLVACTLRRRSCSCSIVRASSSAGIVTPITTIFQREGWSP